MLLSQKAKDDRQKCKLCNVGDYGSYHCDPILPGGSKLGGWSREEWSRVWRVRIICGAGETDGKEGFGRRARG